MDYKTGNEIEIVATPDKRWWNYSKWSYSAKALGGMVTGAALAMGVSIFAIPRDVASNDTPRPAVTPEVSFQTATTDATLDNTVTVPPTSVEHSTTSTTQSSEIQEENLSSQTTTTVVVAVGPAPIPTQP